MSELHVLIVDDDAAIRGLLSMLLASKGYQVTEAESADAAIQIISQDKSIALVLLDMGMPPHEHSAEEGLRVLDYIADKVLSCKVIVLTGQDAEATSYLAIRHGAFDFLSKPVGEEQIFSSFDRAALFIKQSAKLRAEGTHKIELDLSLGEGVKVARNAAEEKLIKQVLSDTDFNVHEAGRRLGLKRENVYYLIKKYGLERDEA